MRRPVDSCLETHLASPSIQLLLSAQNTEHWLPSSPRSPPAPVKSKHHRSRLRPCSQNATALQTKLGLRLFCRPGSGAGAPAAPTPRAEAADSCSGPQGAGSSKTSQPLTAHARLEIPSKTSDSSQSRPPQRSLLSEGPSCLFQRGGIWQLVMLMRTGQFMNGNHNNTVIVVVLPDTVSVMGPQHFFRFSVGTILHRQRLF